MFLCTLENQTKVHNIITISITHLYFQFQKSISPTIGTILCHNKLHYVHVEVYNLNKVSFNNSNLHRTTWQLKWHIGSKKWFMANMSTKISSSNFRFSSFYKNWFLSTWNKLHGTTGSNHGGGGFDHIRGHQLYTHQHALKVIWLTIVYNMMAHEISDKDNYSKKGSPSS